MRGWLRLYGTSVGLGLRYLVRHGYLREAVIRVVLPLEPLFGLLGRERVGPGGDVARLVLERLLV